MTDSTPDTAAGPEWDIAFKDGQFYGVCRCGWETRKGANFRGYAEQRVMEHRRAKHGR